MFMVGHIARVYSVQIRRFTDGRVLQWRTVYIVLAAVGLAIQGATGAELSGSALPIILFVPLAAVGLAAAYTRPTAASILRGSDLSYGLYLVHMPVIGTWLYLSGPSTPWAIATCLLIALGIAAVSWFTVEQRSLAWSRGASTTPGHATLRYPTDEPA